MLKRNHILIVGIGILFLLSGCSFSQGSKDGYDQSPNRENAANSDYYTEMYRPQYHFSTPTGNLADPNGLVYFDGEYHLFHQKNGNWAHAVSKDLLHWEHLPVALEHDELGQAMSGSTVVDHKDTTGFFGGKSGLVAFYTNTTGGEAQSVAYSKDNGRTWERYEGNPVIENPGIKDFRDPKVFWHEQSKQWVMVVSTNQSVTFYNSDNLIDWKLQSQFGDDEGSHVAVWETPDLFPLPVDGDEQNQKWVLHVSVGDNEETNGSTAQYFVGEFDGSTFINDNSAETVLITDFGQDYYAAQSFANIPKKDGRSIWLGWMANWRYPYQSPTDPWMGSMSIPRELTLRTTEEGNIRLFQEPIKELETLRVDHVSIDQMTVTGEYKIEEFSGTTYEFEAILAWDEAEEFGIKLRTSEEEETLVGININDQKVFLDRTNAGMEKIIDRNSNSFTFGTRYETDYVPRKNEVKIRGIVDESSIEIFIDDGEFVFTNLIYASPTSKGIELYTKGGSVEVLSLDLYHLYSTWRERPTENEETHIVLNEEYVTLKVGEKIDLSAQLKPDWLTKPEVFTWDIEEPDLLAINELTDSSISLEAIYKGATKIQVKDEDGNLTKTIKVRVLDR